LNPRRSWPSLILLALLTVAGGVLRLQDVTHSLWLDELHTAWCVAGEFNDIAPRARLGNYSPLYFWLVWGSAGWLGLSEWGVRLPSIVAGIALIPVIYLAAARFTSNRIAALTAAAIVALDGGFFGWYALEARPYALVQLLAVVHVWVLFELVHAPKSRAAHRLLRVAFVVLGLALFYLHYTTILLLAGELAWYAGRRWLPGRSACTSPYSWRALSVDALLICAACVPALGHLREIYDRRANWTQFVSLPALSDLAAPFAAAPAALAILVVIAVAVAIYRRSERGTGVPPVMAPVGRPDLEAVGAEPSHDGLLLALCWYAAPLAAAAVLTFSEVARVFYPRYLMVAAVAIPVLAAAAVGLARRIHLGAAAAVTLAAIFLMTGPWTIDHFVEDWRSAVALVDRHQKDGEPLFVAAGLIEAAELSQASEEETDSPAEKPEAAHRISIRHVSGQAALREYLLFPIHGPYELSAAASHVPLAAAAESLITASDVSRVRQSGGGWFLFRSPEAMFPDHPKPVERLSRQLVEEFGAHGISARVTLRRSFRGVAVIRLEVKHPLPFGDRTE